MFQMGSNKSIRRAREGWKTNGNRWSVFFCVVCMNVTSGCGGGLLYVHSVDLEDAVISRVRQGIFYRFTYVSSSLKRV